MITGPRQVGKTTVLKQPMDSARNYLTLEDLEERHLANTDPALFLQMHSLPIIIDEVQYVPEQFSYIKIAVDTGAAPGAFWLAGSQAFKLMELAQESLAGRIAILHMPGLSQHEIYGRCIIIKYKCWFSAPRHHRNFKQLLSLMIRKNNFVGSNPCNSSTDQKEALKQVLQGLFLIVSR